MLSRRSLIRLLGVGAAIVPGVTFVPFALADAATDRRFVVVILRGALDGLAAVPPYADPNYRSIRGALALAEPGRDDGVLDLDGRFGLHPSLTDLKAMYDAKEVVVFHAVASPYRSRSHFDGQDLLENGGDTPHGIKDGWLNRAIGLMGGGGDRRLGLAVGNGVPLILRGKAPVGSWAPQALPQANAVFLDEVAALYREDPVLGPAIEEGIATQRMNDTVLGDGGGMDSRGGGGRATPLDTAMSAVGKLLADPRGPRIAALDVGGWDTHVGQGTTGGRLAGRLGVLSAGLATLKTVLGDAWGKTAVVVVTEFGRTAAPNGTNGTDHGTASIAFLAGGAVAGGRVVTRWPGLTPEKLYERCDLAPTTDLRAVLKGILIAQLNQNRADVDRVVFPGSAKVAAMAELIHA